MFGEASGLVQVEKKGIRFTMIVPLIAMAMFAVCTRLAHHARKVTTHWTSPESSIGVRNMTGDIRRPFESLQRFQEYLCPKSVKLQNCCLRSDNDLFIIDDQDHLPIL